MQDGDSTLRSTSAYWICAWLCFPSGTFLASSRASNPATFYWLAAAGEQRDDQIVASHHRVALARKGAADRGEYRQAT